MPSESRVSSPTLTSSIKGICAVAVIAVVAALMPWRASTDSTTQGSRQWVPFASTPLTYLESQPTDFHSGRVSSIAVDPRDSTRWLAGVGNGGVWETRDAGDSWTPLTDDAPTLAIGAVTFAPSNPDIL